MDRKLEDRCGEVKHYSYFSAVLKGLKKEVKKPEQGMMGN